jgi:hypothetical protein
MGQFRSDRLKFTSTEKQFGAHVGMENWKKIPRIATIYFGIVFDVRRTKEKGDCSYVDAFKFTVNLRH